MAYTPTDGSLADRVLKFFRTHRDEELSNSDIGKKFDVPTSTVPAMLSSCLANQLLARRRDEMGTQVWIAGPRIVEIQATPQPAHTTSSETSEKPKKRTGGIRKHLPPLNASALKVETGVPKPFVMRAKGFTRYDDVLDKLTGADQSIEVPLEYKAAISKALQAYMKARPGRKLRVLGVSATTCRIYRDA